MPPGIIYTLVFVKNDFEILLGWKKRGLGENKWNGFGGKVEKGETIFEGAIRETKEESNLNIKNLQHIGVLTYEVHRRKKIDLVHVFTTTDFCGDLKESEEMIPKWFNLSQIPFDQMWSDHEQWHNYVLRNIFFHAHSVYSENDEFVKCHVEEFVNIKEVLDNVKTIIEEKTKSV